MTTSSSGNLLPNSPIVNLGNLYVNNMLLTYVGTTSFSVGAGQCRDSTDTVDIIMGGNLLASTSNPTGAQGTNNPVSGSSAVTVTITATGAGGIDTGTVAASTMYYVHAIGDSRGFNNGSALISLSATAPSLPLGYDSFRRIGSVSIDGTSHVRAFMMYGSGLLKTVVYDPGTGPSTTGVTIPSSGTAASATYVNLGVLTTLIPQSTLELLISCSITANADGDTLYLAAPTIDNGTTATVGSMANLSCSTAAKTQKAVVRVPCSLPNAAQKTALTIGAVQTVLYATTAATTAVAFTLNGYVDQL